MPSSPASVAPSGTQTIVMVTAMGRDWRTGTYSAASAAAFGIAPPSPRPAKNRSAPERGTSVAKRDGQRHHAEDDHAAKQRRPPAEPVAGQARRPRRRSSCRGSRARRPARSRCAARPTRASPSGMTMPRAGCRCRRRRSSAPSERRASAGSRPSARCPEAGRRQSTGRRAWAAVYIVQPSRDLQHAARVSRSSLRNPCGVVPQMIRYLGARKADATAAVSNGTRLFPSLEPPDPVV